MARRWSIANSRENDPMWCLSWILGLGLALSFGVLNAIWYELAEEQRARDDAGASGVSSRDG